MGTKKFLEMKKTKFHFDLKKKISFAFHFFCFQNVLQETKNKLDESRKLKIESEIFELNLIKNEKNLIKNGQIITQKLKNSQKNLNSIWDKLGMTQKTKFFFCSHSDPKIFQNLLSIS